MRCITLSRITGRRSILQTTRIALFELQRGKAFRAKHSTHSIRHFAHWQREQLNGVRFSEQRAYWQQQLAGAPAPLTLSSHPLPLHAPRVAVLITSRFPDPTPDRLRLFTRENGVTMFATLLAPVTSLLHFYTGAEDIIIGTPISNRNRKETEGLIGCLINTHALRINVSSNPNFAELARQAQTIMLRVS